MVRRKNVDVYVTGSNAKFLSKDIITEFRGRGDEVHPKSREISTQNINAPRCRVSARTADHV